MLLRRLGSLPNTRFPHRAAAATPLRSASGGAHVSKRHAGQRPGEQRARLRPSEQRRAPTSQWSVVKWSVREPPPSPPSVEPQAQTVAEPQPQTVAEPQPQTVAQPQPQTAAGLQPLDPKQTAQALGEDGGQVCSLADEGQLLGYLKTRLGVGGEFYYRPVIVKRDVVVGTALVVKVYCPDELSHYDAVVSKLDPVESDSR